MKKRRALIAIAVVAAIVIVVVVVVLNAGPIALPVETAEATREDLVVSITVSGRLEAAESVQVYPASAGTLGEVFVSDGQRVGEGEALAVLDTDSLELEVAAAEAAYLAAKSAVGAIDRQAPTAKEIEAAQAGETAAHGAYHVALDAYEALKEAYDAAIPSVRESMEATLAAAEVSRDQTYAAYLSAVAATEKLRSAANTSAERASAIAHREQAKAALDAAKSRLDKATLEAPSGGIVVFLSLGAPGLDGTAQTAARGAPVNPTSPVFSILVVDELDFVADVDEADVASIGTSQTATVSLDGFTDAVFEASVEKIASVSRTTNTGANAYSARLRLREPDDALLVGMRGSADIELDKVRDAVTVPIEALFDEEGDDVLYLVVDGVAKRRVVEVGRLTETRAQVVSGIEPGETVVLTGVAMIADGIPVRAGGAGR